MSTVIKSNDLCYLTIAEASAGLRRKDYSPVDLTEACLERIEALDGKLHSFITITAERARAQARHAEQEFASGKGRGPLHGIPIALKDLYMTKGIRTTCHSAVLEKWVPDYDATAVLKLEEAGTILLGKLGMHEFAFGGPSVDALFRRCAIRGILHTFLAVRAAAAAPRSLRDFVTARSAPTPAARFDTPSAHCGIVGLKPTYGRVSRYGVVPLSWSLDHAGPMARSVEDCALLLQAIAGYDAKDAASANVAVADFQSGLKDGIKICASAYRATAGLTRTWASMPRSKQFSTRRSKS